MSLRKWRQFMPQRLSVIHPIPKLRVLGDPKRLILRQN